MTPEERAKVFLHDNFYLPWDLLEAELAVAIRDAVAEEREACAAIAYGWDDSPISVAIACEGIAAKIRERANKGEA